MTPDAIALVRASHRHLAGAARETGRRFYERLFALAPAARALFPDDVDAQADKLMAMIGAIVEGLDDPDALAGTFAAMGRRHAGYGAREEHYDDVGAALLATFRDVLGERFDDDVEAAWAMVYGELAEAMIAAGHAHDVRGVASP